MYHVLHSQKCVTQGTIDVLIRNSSVSLHPFIEYNIQSNVFATRKFSKKNSMTEEPVLRDAVRTRVTKDNHQRRRDRETSRVCVKKLPKIFNLNDLHLRV